MGSHVGGYTPFEIDITDAAPAGSDVRLTVAVDNQLTNVTIPPGSVSETPDGRRTQQYLHDFYIGFALVMLNSSVGCTTCTCGRLKMTMLSKQEKRHATVRTKFLSQI